MTNENKNQFALIMYGLADNLGGKISKEGLQLRFAALSDLTIGDIGAAATYIINHREKDYPPVPTVKEMRDALLAIKGENLSVDSRAEIQANIVLEKLNAGGRNSIVDFKDPITMRLMVNRWEYYDWAMSITTKEITWWKKDFVSAYKAYSEEKKLNQIQHNASIPIQIENLTEQIGGV